jgi:hypothetical protein
VRTDGDDAPWGVLVSLRWVGWVHVNADSDLLLRLSSILAVFLSPVILIYWIIYDRQISASVCLVQYTVHSETKDNQRPSLSPH